MNKDFTKTKYFKHLLSNAQKMEISFNQFQNEISTLLKKEVDELGVVLKCHLIIEHYIDRYLKSAYPTIVNWESTRLNFAQKLEMINHPRTPLGLYYPGIKCLNTVRNKFSHKLSYQLDEKDYSAINAIMTTWNKAAGKSVPKGLALVENFTVWICMNIHHSIAGIEEYNKSLGLPAYLEWLSEMQEEE